jgi:hypothetical protein
MILPEDEGGSMTRKYLEMNVDNRMSESVGIDPLDHYMEMSLRKVR